MTSLLDAHRWRRMGWSRIALYICLFLLTVHLIRTFSSNEVETIVAESDNGHYFPWYQQAHVSLTDLKTNKYTTTHLSTKERQKLTNNMIIKATQAVEDEFAQIQGIPGSVFKTDAEAAQFRATVDCWTRGHWVSVPFTKGMPHFQDPLYGSCDRKFAKSNTSGQRDAVKYVWESQCGSTGVEVDGENWCKVLRGRHVLLVGDLVHYQLHELFLDTLRDGPAVCFGELNCKDHTVCTEPFMETRLRYLRNDILSVRRKMNANHGHPKADVIEWPFTSASIMRGYPIVIINRAPVLESDESFIHGLIETLRVMRKGNPKALLIYRSTGIGHPFCNEATGPLKEPLTDEALRSLPFGWSEIGRRNAMARVIVEAAGGLFVDLAALSDLRPDGHVGGQDCLRYCIPGPLDSWALILYKVFLGLEGHVF
ncbi:hypothetical protein INT47_000590 [Mucor saturninus]|uniref:Uncharacterized protein n=1 Tax=Mucor saturninus TaxID=64648 RepID=A0A8H7RKH3_9FUNG|nr:hypothetical protein INT47_000590 [Mucor saturninus]